MFQEYALQIELAAQQHAVNMQTISMEQRMKEVEQAEKAAEEEKRIAEEKVAREIELENMKLSSYSSIAGSISSILEVTAGDSKKRLKAAKLAALAEVAINQGVAIAQAVKAGGEYPFPVNLLTIASSVAGAIAALVPAFQAVNSVKLARGGRVSGPGTSTSDSIPAMLSNGEFVVNARATSMFPELLETINNLGLGLGAPARMEKVTTTRIERDNAEALVKALQQMPAPVVSVEEINRTGRRVEALERLSRLA
jgi:flavin reductase (DIM6/NTAB) family NADH-FMN oxidoreductase RutF